MPEQPKEPEEAAPKPVWERPDLKRIKASEAGNSAATGTDVDMLS